MSDSSNSSTTGRTGLIFSEPEETDRADIVKQRRRSALVPSSIRSSSTGPELGDKRRSLINLHMVRKSMSMLGLSMGNGGREEHIKKYLERMKVAATTICTSDDVESKTLWIKGNLSQAIKHSKTFNNLVEWWSFDTGMENPWIVEHREELKQPIQWVHDCGIKEQVQWLCNSGIKKQINCSRSAAVIAHDVITSLEPTWIIYWLLNDSLVEIAKNTFFTYWLSVRTAALACRTFVNSPYRHSAGPRTSRLSKYFCRRGFPTQPEFRCFYRRPLCDVHPETDGFRVSSQDPHQPAPDRGTLPSTLPSPSTCESPFRSGLAERVAARVPNIAREPRNGWASLQ